MEKELNRDFANIKTGFTQGLGQILAWAGVGILVAILLKASGDTSPTTFQDPGVNCGG